MLKFSNVEKLDNKANKDILNKIRDETCTVADINATFVFIKRDMEAGKPVWRDEFNYLQLTIKKLKRRGCNVKRLEKSFNKHRKKLGI
ncbi:MAG: hypothetical protein J6573_07415 [Lactobacillus sp.]|nr:hypothetical protein [Lactobacillus sp.]